MKKPTQQQTQQAQEVKKAPAKAASKPASKAPAKAASKAPAKAKAQAKAFAYAALLAEALAGNFGPTIQRFYGSACAYHKKAGTVFPRARNMSEPLLSVEDARAFIEARKVTSIPPGSKPAQRLFDQMMAEAKAAQA